MIKRLVIRLLLLVLVTFLLAPWALKRENGTRIISVDEFSSFDVSLIKNRYKEAVERVRSFMADDMEVEAVKNIEIEQPETRTLYKWKDKEGEWHFTDQIPKGYPYEEIVVKMNTNIFNFDGNKKKNDEADKNASNEGKTE